MSLVIDLDRQIREETQRINDTIDFHVLASFEGNVLMLKDARSCDVKPSTGQVCVTGKHDDLVKFFARLAK